MTPVPSLLDVLRTTLKQLHENAEFAAQDPHARELRRWLLVTIADLEDQERDALDSRCA